MLARLDLRPGDRQLRQFGYVALAMFALVGGVLWWRGGLFGLDFGPWARPAAFLALGVGLVSAVFSLVHPPANRALFVALSVVTYPIGIVVSHVVLAFVFFGILTPVALVFRLIGRDPLRRTFEPDGESYWEDLPEPGDTADYFRQF